MDHSLKSETDSADLVVVGSSAGGVGALSTLVATLNKSFPAPIVIAQHLDPQRPSQLGSILERRSTLPIVVVGEHGPTKLEGGRFYVVPNNRHVRISDGHVLLEGDHNDRPKPSIDMLVSLPPTAVDHVVEIEQLGPLFFDLLKGVSLAAPTERPDDPLRDLLGQVSAQTNIDFRNYKSSTILRRIGRRMAVTHNSNIRDYGDYLRTHPEEVNELVKAFLIKVTGFFRDPEAFDFLRGSIIPELIERAKANGRTLRMWSAGCATGEEAYSLALLLADQLGQDFPEWNIKIFATDLAADAISFARRGLYPENVLKHL